MLWPAAPIQALQRGDRRVELKVVGDGGYYWIVDAAGGGFEAERFRKGGTRKTYKDVFNDAADGLLVREVLVGRDVSGKTKTILARPRGGDGERPDVRWERVSASSGTLLRVPDGRLKGWYVGLGAAKEDKWGRTVAPLVLVESKKDAAVFRWPSADDSSSP